ncbi:SET domain containing 8 [Lycorma delicatula]|uniref:SET domain containing 8 n=1 Tax=Lycorma delicatula TaxID=130591 RepID=UPI003F50F0DC
MGKGQKKGRCCVVVSDSDKKAENSSERLSTKRKGSKREFQGKLSHASPNTRITRYLQPRIITDEVQQPLSLINIKPAVRNSRNTNFKIMQEANEFVPVSEGEQSLTDDHTFEQADCSTLPLLSHRKSVGVAMNSPSKLLFQPHKKSVKSKRRPNDLMQGIIHKTPPLGESKSCHDNNHKLTEYFPVRRSARRTKKVVLEEKQRHLEEAVLSKCEDGLEVRIFEGKGRGVVATRVFCKGEFVVEYAGELISLDEAKKREQMYAHDQNTGCYMYYFTHKNIHFCVDATPESDRLGRLVNHSRFGNLITKTVVVEDQPHLVLIAKEDIRPGDEITYDYGDRSKESLYYHPWLAS